MASRSVQEIEMEVPSFQGTFQVKKVQKIHSLEIAKARKILMDKQEESRKIHKENVKIEIEKRKREREDQKRKEEEKKKKQEDQKLNKEVKKLSKDLKKLSKNLKKVSKDLNKEAFFTVCEAILAPPVSFSISQGENSELKETALNAPALNADSVSEGICAVCDESVLSLVRTDFEVKESRNNTAIELVKKDVKEKNVKEKKGKKEEKKNNKLIKDLKSSVSTINDLVPSILVHHQVRVLEFSEYYNNSFLLAMEDLEKVHLEEAKAEELRLGNKNSNIFDDFSELDAILDSFDAPQWIDLSNLNNESTHFDDDLGFFCQAEIVRTGQNTLSAKQSD